MKQGPGISPLAFLLPSLAILKDNGPSAALLAPKEGLEAGGTVGQRS